MVSQLLLGLTLLVFIHELGHFLAAKLFKTRVDKFYLFFDFLFPLPDKLNFALFKKKIGETEYGLGWFPLGGYVSIAGMVDETQDADSMASEPQPWEYRSKKGWQKLIIILAGIIFNLIFAMIINFGLLKSVTKEYLPASELKNNGVFVSEYAKTLGFKNGDVILTVKGQTPERYDDIVPFSLAFGGDYTVERIENGVKSVKTIVIPGDFYKKFDKGMLTPYYHHVLVAKVSGNTPASKAGLKPNDIFVKLNNIEITHFDLFKQILDSNKGKTIPMIVNRDSQLVNLTVTVGADGKLGFNPGMKFMDSKYSLKQYSFSQCIKYAITETFKMFGLMGVNFMKMFTGEVKVADSLGGPIEMAEIYGAHWDWVNFWMVTAFISIALAFGNLLPIPALDGGHAIVIIIEMIIGRSLSLKTQQILQTIGTYILLTLMVFVLGKGIIKKLF